jgi:hypothetical protein
MVEKFIPLGPDDNIAFHGGGGATSHVPKPAQVRLHGLLFTRPDADLGRTQIVPKLGYFHARSGDAINFSCAGFHEVRRDVGGKRAISVGDQLWIFENAEFLKLVRRFQSKLSWEYSGGTDLLLANEIVDSQVTLDLSTAIVCQLDTMIKDGAITSVDLFLEQVFSYAERCDRTDPTWGFSDAKGAGQFKSALYQLVLSVLPAAIRKYPGRAKHFVVRDLLRKK